MQSEIEFPKRARRAQTACARQRIWTSRRGRFQVIESKSLFGLGTVYYAIDRGGDTPGLLGSAKFHFRHRTREAAERACAKAAKRQLTTAH